MGRINDMSTYALITNGIVVNLITADSDFISIISQQYDAIVDISELVPSPQNGWTYTNGVFSDPTLTLANVKTKKLSDLQTDVQNYIDSHYSFLTRNQLMNLYTLATFDGLSNRAAYLRPGIDWINSIINYSANISALIQSSVTINDTLLITWDIKNNIAADPALTVYAAIQISN